MEAVQDKNYVAWEVLLVGCSYWSSGENGCAKNSSRGRTVKKLECLLKGKDYKSGTLAEVDFSLERQGGRRSVERANRKINEICAGFDAGDANHVSHLETILQAFSSDAELAKSFNRDVFTNFNFQLRSKLEKERTIKLQKASTQERSSGKKKTKGDVKVEERLRKIGSALFYLNELVKVSNTEHEAPTIAADSSTRRSSVTASSVPENSGSVASVNTEGSSMINLAGNNRDGEGSPARSRQPRERGRSVSVVKRHGNFVRRPSLRSSKYHSADGRLEGAKEDTAVKKNDLDLVRRRYSFADLRSLPSTMKSKVSGGQNRGSSSMINEEKWKEGQSKWGKDNYKKVAEHLKSLLKLQDPECDNSALSADDAKRKIEEIFRGVGDEADKKGKLHSGFKAKKRHWKRLAEQIAGIAAELKSCNADVIECFVGEVIGKIEASDCIIKQSKETRELINRVLDALLSCDAIKDREEGDDLKSKLNSAFNDIQQLPFTPNIKFSSPVKGGTTDNSSRKDRGITKICAILRGINYQYNHQREKITKGVEIDLTNRGLYAKLTIEQAKKAIDDLFEKPRKRCAKNWAALALGAQQIIESIVSNDCNEEIAKYFMARITDAIKSTKPRNLIHIKKIYEDFLRNQPLKDKIGEQYIIDFTSAIEKLQEIFVKFVNSQGAPKPKLFAGDVDISVESAMLSLILCNRNYKYLDDGVEATLPQPDRGNGGQTTYLQPGQPALYIKLNEGDGFKVAKKYIDKIFSDFSEKKVSRAATGNDARNKKQKHWETLRKVVAEVAQHHDKHQPEILAHFIQKIADEITKINFSYDAKCDSFNVRKLGQSFAYHRNDRRINRYTKKSTLFEECKEIQSCLQQCKSGNVVGSAESTTGDNVVASALGVLDRVIAQKEEERTAEKKKIDSSARKKEARKYKKFFIPPVVLGALLVITGFAVACTSRGDRSAIDAGISLGASGVLVLVMTFCVYLVLPKVLSVANSQDTLKSSKNDEGTQPNTQATDCATIAVSGINGRIGQI